MHTAAPTVPFGQRILALMGSHTPSLTQAWVADRAGIDRSLLSRIIKGDRSPTAEVLQSLAPVLGVDVAALAQGTDAEGRLTEGERSVEQESYQAVVRQMIEYEGRCRDLENLLRVAKDDVAKEQLGHQEMQKRAASAHIAKEQAERDVITLRETVRREEEERRRYHAGLTKAVGEIAALQKKLKELSHELAAASTTSRTTQILSGVAAFTGVLTLAHFLGNDKGPSPTSTPKSKSKSGRKRA